MGTRVGLYASAMDKNTCQRSWGVRVNGGQPWADPTDDYYLALYRQMIRKVREMMITSREPAGGF